MATAHFRFDAELNYFLPPGRRQVSFVHIFEQRASVLDMIQAFGVPHPEVGSIEVNGEWVDFSYIVKDGDRIQVYSLSATHPLNPTQHLRSPYPTVFRFVLDVHLGKLANSLRMLGFDTLYRNDYLDEEIAQISAEQNRIVLTRDRGVLMRSLVTYGYYIRSTDPNQQVLEVLRRFNLFQLVAPFQRCIRCNGLLEVVDKNLIVHQLPQKVQEDIMEFHRCLNCYQIYWKGSHYERMQQFINEVLSSQPQPE